MRALLAAMRRRSLLAYDTCPKAVRSPPGIASLVTRGPLATRRRKGQNLFLNVREAPAVCGIVGYVGRRPVQDLLLEGLRKLEYRGYDSAGISTIAGERIESVRAVGNLAHLDEALAGEAARDGAVAVATRPATTGIGHTRWATHGRVSERNAHPHSDTSDTVHVVVNGIVENYLSLKRRLLDAGAEFTSETDAEVIAHLIAHHLETL